MTLREIVCVLLTLTSCPLFIVDVRAADVPTPVATDSRIKTFVYSENDVFSLVTHYGYQSNVEFGLREEVETISIGDRVSWQIVPAGRRIFVRAMTTSARTNMTVVTNKHAYQFDLISVPTPVTPNEELAYVVRFFYPDDHKNQLPPMAYSDDVMPAAMAPGSTAPAAPMPIGGIYNYNYTFSGSDTLAPIKLFDDGRSTYFKFRSSGQQAPVIAMVTAAGHETPLVPHLSGEYWVVDNVSPRFTVRAGGAVVCVYNEKLLHP